MSGKSRGVMEGVAVEGVELGEGGGVRELVAEGGVEEGAAFFLELHVTAVAGADVGAVERRERIGEVVSGGAVVVGVEPGGAVAGLAAGLGEEGSLDVRGGDELGVGEGGFAIETEGGEGEAGAAEGGVKRLSVEMGDVAKGQDVVGVAGAGVVGVAVREGAVGDAGVGGAGEEVVRGNGVAGPAAGVAEGESLPASWPAWRRRAWARCR